VTAQDYFRFAAKAAIGPAVRAAGFKGSVPNWVLTADNGDCSVINLQSSSYSSRSEVRFVVNLAVIPVPWWEWREYALALWSACGLVRPWNDPDRDIERKVGHDPGGILVLELGGRVVGSVMAGYEGHRGWVNYLAVDPAHQGEGFGALLMAEAERRLAQAGCPKINLQVRAANEQVIGFYRHLGYVVDDVVSMGKRLVDDMARARPDGSPGVASEGL